MTQSPKIVVGVLIYNQKGEIFLAKSHKWGDKWVVPGGHLDWGESLEECVKREVKEETNLEISHIESIDIQESIFSENYHEKKHMIFLDYCALLTGGEVVLNDELQEYKWFDPRESMKEENLNPSTRIFIENFIAKNI